MEPRSPHRAGFSTLNSDMEHEKIIAAMATQIATEVSWFKDAGAYPMALRAARAAYRAMEMVRLVTPAVSPQVDHPA